MKFHGSDHGRARCRLEVRLAEPDAAAFPQDGARHEPASDFAADETIHAAGDPPGGIYDLVSGGLRVVFAPSERIPFFAHFFVPGSWTGEAAAITGEPRLVSLVTTRETCAFYLPLPAVN